MKARTRLRRDSVMELVYTVVKASWEVAHG